MGPKKDSKKTIEKAPVTEAVQEQEANGRTSRTKKTAAATKQENPEPVKKPGGRGSRKAASSPEAPKAREKKPAAAPAPKTSRGKKPPVKEESSEDEEMDDVSEPAPKPDNGNEEHSESDSDDESIESGPVNKSGHGSDEDEGANEVDEDESDGQQEEDEGEEESEEESEPAPNARAARGGKKAAAKPHYDERDSSPEPATKAKSARGGKKAVKVVEGKAKASKRGKAGKDPNAPKRPMSSYMLFAQEEGKKVRDAHPEMRQSEVMKELGKRWSEMTDKSKAAFEKKSAWAKERYQDEMKSYVAPPTGDEDNGIKKKKVKKDPSAPKRAQTAYLIFSQAENKKIRAANPSMANKDIMREAAARWAKLSADDRKPWENMASKDKMRYEAEMSDYKKEA